MSQRSFYDKEFEELPDNCGVEYDAKCPTDDVPALSPSYFAYEEALGECDEYDEECRARAKGRGRGKSNDALKLRSKSRMEINGPPAKTASQTKRFSLTTKSGNLYPGVIPDPPYEGLPKDYYKKSYRPDYPTELKMRTECGPKPASRKTGASKTHPKAVFDPSESKVNTGPQIDPALLALLEEPSPLELNRMPPPIISSSDELIVDWLHDHNVQMMLEYFLGLCVVHRPDDPWIFISQLCSRLIEARNNIEAFDALPRLLTPVHTEAIFRIYDRIENGFITVSQYKSAMEAMGLSKFSLTPEGLEKNEITKDVFVKEATDAINELLRSFMVFEENPDQSRKSSIDSKKAVPVPRAESPVQDDVSLSGSYSSSNEYSDGEEGEEEEARLSEVDDESQTMGEINKISFS